jgi:hypothetical protein
MTWVMGRSRKISALNEVGEEWIRTTVGRSQQIYSLPPLATRAPHQMSGLSVAAVFPKFCSGIGRFLAPPPPTFKTQGRADTR